MKGLVIRYFSGGFYLCDGKPLEDCENDGEIYVGNAVKWFETWEEANDMRNICSRSYVAFLVGLSVSFVRFRLPFLIIIVLYLGHKCNRQSVQSFGHLIVHFCT